MINVDDYIKRKLYFFRQNKAWINADYFEHSVLSVDYLDKKPTRNTFEVDKQTITDVDVFEIFFGHDTTPLLDLQPDISEGYRTYEEREAYNKAREKAQEESRRARIRMRLSKGNDKTMPKPSKILGDPQCLKSATIPSASIVPVPRNTIGGILLG